MGTQTSSVETNLNLENVKLDNSTSIGLQGEDLSNMFNFLQNKDATNSNTILAQQGAIQSIVQTQAQSNQNIVASLQSLFGKAGKWLLYGGIGFGLIYLYKSTKKRGR